MANGTIAASQLEMLSLSGTGIITITPPATNTNRAITLPDAAGALVVSGTTPSLNGITFPATQVPSADANTLDDYEEGTWTPVLVPASGSITTQSSYGYYTKTGNSVTLLFAVTVLNGGTASGTGTLTGLPFTSQTVSPALGGSRAGTCSVREDGVSGNFYFGYVLSNNTQLTITTSTAAALSYANNACYVASLVYRSAN